MNHFFWQDDLVLPGLSMRTKKRRPFAQLACSMTARHLISLMMMMVVGK